MLLLESQLLICGSMRLNYALGRVNINLLPLICQMDSGSDTPKRLAWASSELNLEKMRVGTMHHVINQESHATPSYMAVGVAKSVIHQSSGAFCSLCHQFSDRCHSKCND